MPGSKLYTSHSYADVTGIEFYYFLIPSDIEIDDLGSSYKAQYDFDDIVTSGTYPHNYSTSDVTSGSTTIVACGSYEDKQLVYKWGTTDQAEEIEGYAYLSFGSATDPQYWNTIAFYTDKLGEKTYLSIIYWLYPIPGLNPSFRHLTLYYSAEVLNLCVEVLEDDYLAQDLIDHLYNGVTASSTDTGVELTCHTQLYDNVMMEDAMADSTVSSSMSTSSTNAMMYITSSSSIYQSTDYGDLLTRYVGTGKTNSSTYYFTPTVFYGPLSYDTSTRYTYTGSGQYFLGPPLPSTVTTDDWRLYFYDLQIAILYLPNSYTAYFSYVTSTSSSRASWTWTSWTKVCSTLTYNSSITANGVKVFIPAYFALMPIAFLCIDVDKNDGEGDRYEWGIAHVLSLSSTLSTIVNNSNTVNSIGTYTAVQEAYFYLTVEEFLETYSTRTFINAYTPTYYTTSAVRNMVCDYWWCQIYITYQTIRQCIRRYPEHAIQPLDTGVLCTKDGEDSKFVYYSDHLGKLDNIPVHEIPEGCIPDNNLYVDGNKVVTINTGESHTYTYSSNQMRYGVMV